MKQERMTFSVCSAAVLLGSVFAFACVMCLVDAFKLMCSREFLILVCCITAGVAVAAMGIRHGWILGLCMAIFCLAMLIWKSDLVKQGFRALLYHVTYEYSRCFRDVALLGEAGADAAWFLAAPAAALTWIGVWTVCRQGHSAVAVIACAPVLVLCLLVVDLAPVFWLLLLTAVLLLFVMSGRVRTHSAHDGSRLIWWLVLPVTAVFALLLVLSPVRSYVRSDWSSALQRIAEGEYDFSVLEKTVTSALAQNKKSGLKAEDLSKVGPRIKTGAYALRYKSDIPVSCLRGSSLAVYESSTWRAAELPSSLSAEQTQLIRPSQTAAPVLIETAVSEPVLYTPYYPSAVPGQGEAVGDSYFENANRQREYAVAAAEGAAASISPEYETFVQEVYLQLPQELQTPLSEYLHDHGLAGAGAETIADAVRASGIYDLNVSAVPEGEDFVLWFLNTANRGYCVHFSSATVLLLRSAGIPARYVTGYAVEPVAGQWVEVTQDTAHAWVEYYISGVGWLPLDPTPAAYREEASGAASLPDAAQPQEETSSDSRQPAHTTVPDGSAKTEPSLGWLWYLLSAAAVLVLLRRYAVLLCRCVQMGRGHPNRRSLAVFSHLVRLYKAGGEPVPERWICLAEKAKFSQHTISEEELQSLLSERKERIARMKEASFLRKLWHRFGLVLY